MGTDFYRLRSKGKRASMCYPFNILDSEEREGGRQAETKRRLESWGQGYGGQGTTLDGGQGSSGKGEEKTKQNNSHNNLKSLLSAKTSGKKVDLIQINAEEDEIMFRI